ncbi:MAG TPA: hypothetical protein VMJ74_15690, partial [Pseudomonadales bacterium]|nr:hypothetical protein [Pseudomonadales bacterium]
SIEGSNPSLSATHPTKSELRRSSFALPNDQRDTRPPSKAPSDEGTMSGSQHVSPSMKVLKVLFFSAVIFTVARTHGDLLSLPNGHVLSPGLSVAVILGPNAHSEPTPTGNLRLTERFNLTFTADSASDTVADVEETKAAAQFNTLTRFPPEDLTAKVEANRKVKNAEVDLNEVSVGVENPELDCTRVDIYSGLFQLADRYSFTIVCDKKVEGHSQE